MIFPDASSSPLADRLRAALSTATVKSDIVLTSSFRLAIRIARRSESGRRPTNMETDDRLDRWQQNCQATLENGSVILCHDKTAWVAWMKAAQASGEHLVAESDVEGFRVSTMFLGINVNLTGFGLPLWFQTMVYRRSIDGTLGRPTASGTFRYSPLPMRSPVISWSARK